MRLSPSVVIVGAGVSGLSIAYRLQERVPQARITVLDEASRPGGVVWTERSHGFHVETAANGFLDSKPSTLQLARDLGLGASLVPASSAAGKNRYLFLDGSLRRLPNSLLSFLGTGLLSWRGKLDLLREYFRKPRTEQGDESIDAFFRRRLGAEVAEVFGDAIVTGIYAGDPTRLSLPACFPRLAQFEREHGGIVKGMGRAARQRRQEARARGEEGGPARMWSLNGGLRVLVESLAGKLRSAPHLGAAVRRIERTADADGPRWIVHGEGGAAWQADVVVLACPAYRQATMLEPIDTGLAAEIAGIRYNRVAVVALGYRQADVPTSVDGFGFIAPQRSRRDLLGVQWCSSIFPDRAPSGCVLMRALCGGGQRPEIVDWDDERLVEGVSVELRVAMGITARPIFQHLVRWPRAIPQYELGHLDRVERIETRLREQPGLFLAGNAYRGVALNDCTEQGSLLAERVASFLSGQWMTSPKR